MDKKLLLVLIFILTLCACRKDGLPLQVLVPKIDSLSISSDSIKVNPYSTNILTAQVNFSTSVKSHTKIIIRGRHGKESDVIHEFQDEGFKHSIPVVGLYPDYANVVEIIEIDNNNTEVSRKTISIKTSALPSYAPYNVSIDKVIRDEVEPGMILVSDLSNMTARPQVAYLVDNFGDIRWFLDFRGHPTLDKAFFTNISRLKNGNFYFADESTSKVYELGILGNIVKTWDFSGYTFHHEVYEEPNGNFLTLVSKDGISTVEDFILEIDRATGKILTEWDLRESLDQNRTSLPHGLGEEDWFHANAITYDPLDHTIIVSGRHQGVVKLTFDNRVEWILSPHRGWETNKRGDDLAQKLLAPLDKNGMQISDLEVIDGGVNHTDFEWIWYQHAPVITPKGTLLLFDNGNTRNFKNTRDNPYSRAVEYRIDEQNMTIQQLWNYGNERGKETFSAIVSSVSYLPGRNHVLFAPGNQVFTGVGNGGKIVEIDYATKKVVFEMNISNDNGWGFFRAERMSIYPIGV